MRTGPTVIALPLAAFVMLLAGACDEPPRRATDTAAPTAPSIVTSAPSADDAATTPEPDVAAEPYVARRVQTISVDTEQWLFDALVPLDSHSSDMIVTDFHVAGVYDSRLPVEGLGELRLTLERPANPGQAFAARLEDRDGLLRKVGWGRLLRLPTETALVLQLADDADPPLPPELHFKAALLPHVSGPPASLSGVLRFPSDPKYLQLDFSRPDA